MEKGTAWQDRGIPRRDLIAAPKHRITSPGPEAGARGPGEGQWGPPRGTQRLQRTPGEPGQPPRNWASLFPQRGGKKTLPHFPFNENPPGCGPRPPQPHAPWEE